MSARAVLWAAGLAGSVAAHVGAAALLMIALRPEPVDTQPQPTSRLDVQAYEMDRSQAREAQPEAEAAPRADTDSTAVAPGAIPQSSARPLSAPTGKTLFAAAPDAEPLRPDQARGPHLPAARAVPEIAVVGAAPAAPLKQSAPVTTTAEALTQSAETATPVAPPMSAVTLTLPEPARVAPQRPDAAPVILAAASANRLPAAQPVAARASQAQPVPAVMAPTEPTTAALPDTAPAPQSVLAGQIAAAPVASNTPQGDRVRATLAFPGGGEGGVDPVSLAAFQSFMQPGDIQASGDTLRDGVATLLAQVPCSRLQVSFDPDTATLQVNGHIPEGDLRTPVLAALQAQMGADIAVSDNILILPRPQCGALAGISAVGLPQSTDQNTNPLLIGEDTQARVLGFVKDQRLSFDITAPDYPAYVYVDFFDAGGDVLHLAPNDQVPLTLLPPETAFQVGSKTAEDQGLQLFIGPPYGQEISVAFAASEPLYDAARPLVEPAAPYLDWLKDRVAEARKRNPDFKGEWVYFFVTTSER